MVTIVSIETVSYKTQEAVVAIGRGDLAERVRALHADRPFDAVLDYLWGEPAEMVLTAMSSSHPSAHYHPTRFVQIGSMAGPTMQLPAGVLRSNGIVLSGMALAACHPMC